MRLANQIIRPNGLNIISELTSVNKIWHRFSILLQPYFRSMGLHREAEMIEQQLKMKQNTGQLMPSGNVLFTNNTR